mmetsp:Transcript_25217/g.72585  ORF Transcript_25217/g.72585 Transcript_25217/m.72585 type:complete len:130 (-) Transcript_25217:693-1082(-)
MTERESCLPPNRVQSTLSMFCTLLKLALFCAHPLAALGFTPPTDQAFAVFGNDATKALIKQWSPRPMRVETGSVMLPASTENMQARVLFARGVAQNIRRPRALRLLPPFFSAPPLAPPRSRPAPAPSPD